MIGSTISHYRILDKLGEGGMGVVYKAEDTKLERTVALKFLAAHLLDDDEAKQRFLREAKAAAALHHANICPVHEIDEAEGRTFISMAFVDGETLEDRIARGPLPIRDALEIGQQIAKGLAAAHEKGIVHRDIKPANVLVAQDGQVTIMDFGLARLTEASRLTKADTTMGTVAYMSPEQAQGGEIDHRTDLWALGCVVYEMIAGARPFKGAYDQALLYEIVQQEPEPLTGVRAGVPMDLEFIVGKCLAKDAADRYQHASEIAVDLRTLAEKMKSGRSTILRAGLPTAAPSPLASVHAGNVAAPAPNPSGVVVPKHLVRLVVGLLALSIIAAAAVSLLHFSERPPEPLVRRFSIAPNDLFGGIISPDGRHIAYIAGRGVDAALLLRRLDNETAQQLAAPADIDPIPCMAWSPDSSAIVFAQGGELKRAPLSGGAPVTVCELPTGGRSACVGAAWSPDGETVVFSSGTKPYAVSAGGGEPRLLFETGAADAPSSFWSPHFRPEPASAGTFVFDGGSMRETELWIADLGAGAPRRLAPGTSAWYAGSGHLVHGSVDIFEPGLWALPFSLETLAVEGESFRIEQAGFLASVGQDGTMVYTDTVNATAEQLVWRDRAGALRETVSQPQPRISRPALSPDGRLVAVGSNESGSSDIWVHDTVRGTKTRLTFGEGNETSPVWSPSGLEIAYGQGISGGVNIASKSVGDAGAPTVLVDTDDGIPYDAAWLPDGQGLVYSLFQGGSADIWYAVRSEDGFEHKAFLQTPTDEGVPTPSPDGRYVAYVSDESGRREVFVQRFPDGTGKRQVSVNGGAQPVWRRDGGELFYVEGTTLMAVVVTTDGGLTLGRPQELFESEDLRSSDRHAEYDVSPDGERFLTAAPADDEQAGSVLRVVENWHEQFRDREASR